MSKQMLQIQKRKKESGIDDLGTLVYKIARDKLVDCFDFNVSKILDLFP